jgi:hypothetical protein
MVAGSDELSFARRRERAIKDLLARSAPKIDEWVTRGLVGSLKIPLSWVNEAKVRSDFCCLVRHSVGLTHSHLNRHCMPLIPATFTTRMNSIYPQLHTTLHMRLLCWSSLPTLLFAEIWIC